MRSLFAKLFLWFWLAMLAIGAALLMTARYWGPDRGLPDQREMEEYAAEIRALHGEEGMGSVAGYLRSLGRQQDARFVLWRGDGRGPSSRRLPPELRETLENLDGLDSGESGVAGGFRYRAVPLVMDDGRPRLLLALQPQRRFGDLPGWLRLLVAAAVTGLLSALLASHLSRPARLVRDASKRLAAGELSVRVPEPGGPGDEISALARDFNAMASRLEASMEARNQLLRDLSHELRSPLARMQVALELSRRAAPESGRTSLDRMEREIERLDSLIGQILGLARLEAGTAPVSRERVDIRELLQDICEDADFEARAEGCGVALTSNGPAVIAADRFLLHSAFDNIIRNAVRHAPQGTQVSVSLEAGADTVRVLIDDDGPGIPPQRLDDVFEPFVRVSPARERESGGYGLGLSIARRAIDAHGGRVEAANRNGGGLRVTVILPG